MRASVLLLCAALAAAPARADNAADEADLAFALGNQAFLKRDFERALASYFLSWRLVPNTNVLFNIARCYEALERADEAYRYYHDLSLSPALAAEDRREVAQALERIAPKVALVVVETEPAGAEVFIDRVDLGSRGRTPRTLALPPGEHLVRVELAGWRAAEAKVAAQRGRALRQAFALERILGRVRLAGTPEGALVRETPEGPELGRLPALLALAPGRRLLVVQAPDHLPAQLFVDVRPDETVEARVALAAKPRPTGKVVVTASRDAALVRVDGADSGFTPVVLTLSEGRHSLEVSTPETAPLVRELDVGAGAETRVHAPLRYVPPAVSAASRGRLDVDEAPASVTVLAREELQAFGWQTLPEALQAVRGLYFMDDRLYTYAGVRGFSPPGDLNTRLLVLWDGHPINDAWAAQGFLARDLQADLSEVERIEVVRGPASALFGTGAFFGVVNVVPRERLPGGRRLEAAAGAGGQGGVKAHAAGGAGGEQASVLLSGTAFAATGAPATYMRGLGTMLGSDGEQALSATARARWKGLSLAALYNRRRKEIPTGIDPAEFGVPGSNYVDERAFAEGRWEREAGRLRLEARLSWDGYRYVGTYARAAGLRTTRAGADWLGGEARAGLRLGGANRLSLSLEGQRHAVDQRSSRTDAATQERARTVVSAALLDEWRLHPRVFLQAGLRADRYSDVDEPALSPRAALVLRPYAAGLTKAVAGRAFRAPTTYELFINDDYREFTGTARPALRPEYIATFELEHAHDFTPELRLTAGAYHNRIDGLLLNREERVDGVDCAQGDCWAYVNAETRLTATGAEAQLRWQPGRFTFVEGACSFVALGGAGRSDEHMYPAWQASLRALVPLKEGLVRLAASARWQSAYTHAGPAWGEALLADAGLSGDYGRLRWFAGVRNLLDDVAVAPISTDWLVPQYGRSFWLEVAAGL